MVLIDTDILIDITRGIPTTIQHFRKETQRATPLISGITRKELLIGCRNKDELIKMTKFLPRYQARLGNASQPSSAWRGTFSKPSFECRHYQAELGSERMGYILDG